MIRRYTAWRNRNAHDRPLREVVNRASVAWHEVVVLPAEDGRRRRPPAGPALRVLEKVVTTSLTEPCAIGDGPAVAVPHEQWPP
jgi:hypothetical protein